MFHCRPALRFVLLFVSGIIIAEWILFSPNYVFLIAITFVSVSAFLIWLNRWQFIASVSLQCSIFLLGILLQILQQHDFRTHELAPIVTDEQVTLFGTVDSEPTRKEQKMSCVVRTDSIIRFGRIERDDRRLMILLRLEKGEHFKEEIEFGNKIELRGILEPFPFQRNPGEFDYGKYLALNNIQGVVSTKGLQNVSVGRQGSSYSIQSWTYFAQRALYQIIDKFHSPRHASFLKGIIFGYRAEIPPDVKQSFMDTGTIHILAVSGSNVAFVAFMFFSILGFFRLPKKAIGGATIFGLIVYMLVTGMSPSVVRATIMAIVILCGTMFERKADIYNSISVAAMILLLCNTNTLFDVGFQLSFAAVISIVYFYPRLELLIKKTPERFKEIKMIDAVLKLFAVSLAAQLGTVPFTAYYFGRVSIISLLANIVVVPISGLNTFIGFAEVVFSFISYRIADLFAAANEFLVWFLLGFVKYAASVPFAYCEAWQLSAIFIIGYYVIVLSIFNLNLPRVRIWILIFILILGNYALYADVWLYINPKLTANVIDVGQGDAILVEFPNGKRLLIDAGPSYQQFDAGERTIIPFLKRKGITKINYFLITHPHSDHIGGAVSVMKSVQVDTLLMASIEYGNRQVREVIETALTRNIGMKETKAGNKIQIDKDARVYVVYPKKNQLAEKNLNNSSVVLKIVYGNSTLLLVGDAEVTAEQRMIQQYQEFLSSDILKTGHHGSITSTSEEFLQVVHPWKALISVGNHNKFRHPSPFTLKRLKFHSIEIDRTDKSGAIVLESNGKRWIQREWRRKF